MSSSSTELQYGLRHVNGVPVWDGDILALRDYETAALWFRAGLKPGEQERAVARLWANLQGFKRVIIKNLKMPEELSDSLVSCETALSHQCRCLMPTRRYKRTIKSNVGQVQSSETTS